MKKLLSFVFLLILASCSSYNSIADFYEAHKNDNQVTAFRVPQFMFSLVRSISPEMNSIIGDTKDLRYMQFPSATDTQSQFLNNQMNSFTGNSFIEIYRKNDHLKRNVISVREKRDVIKEILVYKNDNINGSFLYFKGNFDPVQVRKMAANNEFESFSQSLLPQMLNTNVPPTE
ncbi:DUF4252 domain-containing protein [Flavobacterium sp. ASW18X]|uniref:DUF4252 domain-containing protein n=1 Tax=Flavobacterium sp. ASW18X TaxID=2572595 RepID=UPI0010ADBA78|nr:DUF4252 domain-containing protein [Flavobacterium sp. ASW18X]TKD65888.1 DUF4252 domain-containing protein [Flavobacterium sp. ASW18X]